MSERTRFDRPGPLALRAESIGFLFTESSKPPVQMIGDAAIISITGPMSHHDEGWWESYDSIRERAHEAFESSAKTVVLRIDSPGGDVYGCFELARDLRAMAARSGKRLIAFADSTACSGGYALACAAERIYVPETGELGSIGVVTVVMDATAADAQEGLRFGVITSGKRKADGCPHVVLDEGVQASFQGKVDQLAEIFFGWVAEARGIPVERIRGLEAATLHGASAVKAGLADEVMSWSELLATIQEENVPMTYDEIIAALEELAKGEGEDANKAKKALEEIKGAAETPAEDPPAEEPAASESAKVISLLESIQAERAAEKKAAAAKAEAEERKTLIASHQITNAAVKAWLEDPKTPIQSVRDACRVLPPATTPNLAAAMQVQPTTGSPLGLTERELRICKELGCKPEDYVARKAAMGQALTGRRS